MNKNETLKAIYNKYDMPVFICGVEYVLDKGMSVIADLTDEQISAMNGGQFMGDDFIRAIAKCGREIAQSVCSFHDLYTFCAENIWPVKANGRMEELASTALSYLDDNGLLLDYLDDRYIELSDEERDFFCLETEDEEMEEEYE